MRIGVLGTGSMADALAGHFVRELVRDVGCEPVSGGGLDRAGLPEATAALFTGVWAGQGADVRASARGPAPAAVVQVTRPVPCAIRL
jgi:hypothetical protein